MTLKISPDEPLDELVERVARAAVELVNPDAPEEIVEVFVSMVLPKVRQGILEWRAETSLLLYGGTTSIN